MINRAIAGSRCLCLAIASLFFAAATSAHAQGIELKGTVQVEQQVEVDGKATVRLIEPKTVVPGDRLVFATDYENTGTEVAEDIIITNSVPPAVTFAGVDNANTSQVSVDGGTTWGQLGALTVSDGAGRRSAALADVTHVRWTVPRVAQGAIGTVIYRGMVR